MSTQSTGLSRDERGGAAVADPLYLPLVVSPAVAMQMLSVGRTQLYKLLDAKELDSYLEGRVRRITVASIQARIHRKLEEGRKTAA